MWEELHTAVVRSIILAGSARGDLLQAVALFRPHLETLESYAAGDGAMAAGSAAASRWKAFVAAWVDHGQLLLAFLGSHAQFRDLFEAVKQNAPHQRGHADALRVQAHDAAALIANLRGLATGLGLWRRQGLLEGEVLQERVLVSELSADVVGTSA